MLGASIGNAVMGAPPAVAAPGVPHGVLRHMAAWQR